MTRRAPRWLWGYGALAAFSLATVGVALDVGMRLADRFATSVVENDHLAAQLERYRRLTQLAQDVNAPGNDVFASLDPVRERARVRAAHAAFVHALRDVRAGVRSDAELAGDEALLDDCARAVDRMVIDAESVLERVTANDEQGATFAMAEMDRKFHDVLDRLDTLATHAHDLQRARLAAYRHAALQVRTQQQAVGALIVVMIVGLVAYGMRLAREARRTEEHEAELLATVSHELRTPLASLLGFTELLLARDYPVETRRDYVGIVHAEAVRLTNLVNDFLDLQRLEAGILPATPVPVDLAPLLAEIGRVFVAPSPRHRLVLRLPDHLPLVSGDPESLRQVIGNLLSNAVKYSPDGGPIEVGAIVEHTSVRVWVSDAGIGIPHEALTRLFSKFYRVENDERRRIGGTGLGLALVKRLVERYGGTVGVDTAPGRGSTFWFRLRTATAVDAA